MGNVNLREIIRQYPNCTENRAKLRATLRDCYPQAEHRREINVILAVYESGILSKLRGKDSLTPFESSALCTQIENDYGVSAEYAVEGLIAWGDAWGVKISVAIPEKAAPPPPTAPVPPKPIIPVQGSVSEYVIEEKEEGWFITKFQGFEQEVMTVPNIINGKHIVGIGQGVFQGCKGIREVTVSDGIRFLEDGVFKECSLEKATLPASLVEIGKKCFYNSELKSLVVSDGVVRIGGDAFCLCFRLVSVKLPDTVTEIEGGAFHYSRLTDIILPKYLKVIHMGMFAGCNDLSNVTLPECCEEIESKAFYRCNALREIRIPASVSSIADDAFSSSGLKTIYCAPGSVAMEFARKKGIQCKPL